ncbi:MAG: stage III sporulation protein AG [Lachnospiraceae bacterium]|nr:stage III sporulation protein AG [Lachnospiraceae bacterium]
MTDKHKELIEKTGFSKWFQKDNLIVLILGGILLFVIALPVEKSTKDSKESYGKSKTGGEIEVVKELHADTGGMALAEEEYVLEMESKLEKILSGMEGVGKVRVMVTLSATAEYVVEKDEIYNRSQTNEEDSEGGSRIVTQIEEQQTTIYNTTENVGEPYVIKTLLPTVEGVVVVAEGAGNGEINKNITDVVQALFDVEVHKVKVVKMSRTN